MHFRDDGVILKKISGGPSTRWRTFRFFVSVIDDPVHVKQLQIEISFLCRSIHW